jgi:hypothetical protein
MTRLLIKGLLGGGGRRCDPLGERVACWSLPFREEGPIAVRGSGNEGALG